MLSYVKKTKLTHGASLRLLDTAHKQSGNEDIVRVHTWYVFNTVLLSTSS